MALAPDVRTGGAAPNTSGLPVCWNLSIYTPEIGPLHLTHISLQCIVFLVGLTGNLTLIYIIASRRNLRTTPNLFIGNLAAADCTYLMLFIPCDIISGFGVQLPLFFCKAIYFCRFLTVGVSVFTLLGLAIDRCLAITRPMSNLKSSRALVPKLGLFFIWVAAVPYAVSTHIEQKQHGCKLVPHCYPFPESWGPGYRTGMLMAKLFLYYLVPGVLIAVFYGLMACRLMRTPRAHEFAAAAEANTSAASQTESRRKLAKLVMRLSAVFFVAWGPDYIVMLHYFLANRVPVSFVWIKMLAKLLPSAYSASNPITLCIISRKFRAHFLEAVTCGRRPARDSENVNNNINNNIINIMNSNNTGIARSRRLSRWQQLRGAGRGCLPSHCEPMLDRGAASAGGDR